MTGTMHAASVGLAVVSLAVAGLALPGGNQALAGTGSPGQDESSSSMWITREQQAQRLLDAGRPAEAARLFSDPRRRAYADQRAGHYEEAAKLLAPLRDVDSQYNRGNALAHSGELLSALAAYDAALAQAPDDRDARHNRDVVAKLLAEQARRQAGQGSASQSSASGQHGDRNSSNGEPRSSNQQSAQNARSGKSSGSQAGQAPSTGGATPEQEAEQARQDAALAAGLKNRPPRQGGRPSSGADSQGGSQSEDTGAARTGRVQSGTDLPWPPPKSEQAIALEQWLRRIPEDPGGLLRRKFLIEHMERQERSEP